MSFLTLCLLLCTQAAWRVPVGFAPSCRFRDRLGCRGRCRTRWACGALSGHSLQRHLPDGDGRLGPGLSGTAGSGQDSGFRGLGLQLPFFPNAVDYTAFDPDDPTLFPLAVEVVAAALAWLRDRPGSRGAAGYGSWASKQTRGAERAKKPTLAGLAAQQSILQDLVVNLVDQVQALAEGQAKGSQAPRAQGQADLAAQVPSQVQVQVGKPVLTAPLHQTLPPPPPRTKRLSDILGPPPPARAPQADMQVPPAIEGLGPWRRGPHRHYARRVAARLGRLIQAKALSSLVAQLFSGSANQLLDSSGSGSLST